MKMLVIQMIILFKSLPLWEHYTTLRLFTIVNQEQLLHNGLQTLKKNVVVEIRTLSNKFLSPYREVPKAVKKFLASVKKHLMPLKKYLATIKKCLKAIKKVFSPRQEILDGTKKVYKPLSGNT